MQNKKAVLFKAKHTQNTLLKAKSLPSDVISLFSAVLDWFFECIYLLDHTWLELSRSLEA